MKTVADFLKILVNNISLSDEPVNVLIDGKLYDIKSLYFDENIYEYVLELEGGYEYNDTHI